ncbi:acyl-CoA mutase large subunit family protein [Bradyrhizobium sp.]|uniref:acyl-CoA mutase large subunit family protein n=1 Tax=Bradyrhizobium sp. TaxID=376 RepID=UPI00239EB726|nr:acyl-CoA mutase large subunit family protein [Bradyrhizobium sp.]MDE2378765.1 acyl-CoA mutase large subunit family protein [Bradyrhizobium sp.]
MNDQSKLASKMRPVINESGIEIKPLYTAEDVVASGGVDDSLPGNAPFTRGIHSLMYRHRPFTMRQYTGFANAADTNERFKYLIANGQTGLNVAFDLATQCGYDSDAPEAAGEVGRVGMAIDTLRDFEIAFDGIDLDAITVSLTINGAAASLIAMFLAMAEKRGYDLSKLRGTAQNDILKEFIGRGTWIYPVEPSVKLVADTIEYCAKVTPKYSPVSVCGYHIRESGASPAEEMGYAFAIAKAYTDMALARGLDIDEFAGRLSFNFNIFGNLFEQVAKFRAGRRRWSKIILDEYGARRPESGWMRMIAGGGGFGLTIEQPENNIMRGAYYALAAALGGAQTMALCCYDEAYTIPTPRAQRLSLRTMQMLTEEVGLADTVDPLGGSYYVETLTNQTEQKITEAMQWVDAQGGIVRAVSDGVIQARVSEYAYRRQRALETGELRKVGVNCYEDSDEEKPQVDLHGYDEAGARQQIENVRKVRAARSNEAVARALKALRADAEAGRNVMPALVDAVKVYATVGEMNGALVDVYGRFQEPTQLWRRAG